MATPHVSGLAALVRSHCPGLTNDQVVAAMQAAAEDLGPPGWDVGFGAGRIDAGRALATACAG
jgi:subtilisin family serine protease